MWLRRATELFVLLAFGVLLAAWLFQCEACWLAVWETRIVFAVGVLAMAAAGAVIVSERRQGWPGVRAAVIGGMVGLAAFVACVLTWHGDIGLFADCFAKSVL
jgi:hypothetical protein